MSDQQGEDTCLPRLSGAMHRLPRRYAWCRQCNIIFWDDLPLSCASYKCPACHVALVSGMSWEEAGRHQDGGVVDLHEGEESP